MAGELHIMDSGFEEELLALPAPLAFIDFETVPARYIIPGTMLTDAIPCQWSCHTLPQHGLDWSEMEHYEYLWIGDAGWNPIYAFVETLYNATADAATILIYSTYELRCLKTCIQLAENDMEKFHNGEITKNYVVVDGSGEKVPLMDIAPSIRGWCESIMERCYDMCYGYKGQNSGVTYWLQSPDFETKDSIKYVSPACMAEYSGSADMLAYYGIPENGYEGLRQAGQIAKGDECTSRYKAALDRPHREGVPLWVSGQAPFDEDIAEQCLVYCCLDTLSMVIIYMAVLEATERWRKRASSQSASYAMIVDDDGMIHSIQMDGDPACLCPDCDSFLRYDDSTGKLVCDYCNETFDEEDVKPVKAFRKICQPETGYPWDTQIELYTEEELQNMNINDYYSLICPECRRLNNEAAQW